MFKKSINNFLAQNKHNKLNPKAVFFDMDGVLFDSMPYHASAWVSAMNDIGIPFTTQDVYMNEGRTGQSTIDGAFNIHLNRNSTEEERQTIYELKSKYFEAFEPPALIPFAVEMLDKLKSSGIDIFLVTGSGQPSLLDSLHDHFPNTFTKERMVTAYDVVHGKPHPEPYLIALKKSGLLANEVVVVENAPLGAESASAAGLFTIAINTGPLDPEALYNGGANIVLESMESLFEKWDQFFTQCQ